MEQGINLHGASAIIEKDFASGLLAEELNADTLLILTSVEKVSLNKDTDHETYLGALSAEEAQKYIDEGQFAAGSMLPKIEQVFPSSAKAKTAVRSSRTSLTPKTATEKKPELSSNNYGISPNHIRTLPCASRAGGVLLLCIVSACHLCRLI